MYSVFKNPVFATVAATLTFAGQALAVATSDLPKTLPPIYIDKTLSMKKNEPLATMLSNQGFEIKDVYAALAPLLNDRSMRNDLTTMRPGQQINLIYLEGDNNTPVQLTELTFHTHTDRTLKVVWDNGTYKASREKRELSTEQSTAVGTIDSSLYANATEAGLPAGLVKPFANLFAWDLDFTRDIIPGATFKVVFEKVLDEHGDYLRSGNILAAEMTTKGKTYQAFRYEVGGIVSYYDASGVSKRKSLLRTPLEFTRISSRFNLSRKHPILGYTRAHKGTDFAAPTGTPVKAAGDGVVERANWYGGYGRYVRLKHDNGFKTAYAHLNGFARGVTAGKKVRQGDIIGYVGTSGRSTGPHLHYEVLKNNIHVDALKIKMPQNQILPSRYAANFKQQVAGYVSLWNNEIKVAERQ